MAIGYAETYYPPGVQPQWTGALQQSDEGGNINRYAFEYTPVSKEVQQKQLEEFKRATAPGGTGDVEFNMQEAVKQLGLERAEQAMTMAMRYQGQRMYNQALKNGEDPATALAKAAPMMFYSKTGGNAGEMINALRPRTAAPPDQLEIVDLPGGRKAMRLGKVVQVIPETGPTPQQVISNQAAQDRINAYKAAATARAADAATKLKMAQEEAAFRKQKILFDAAQEAAKIGSDYGQTSPMYNTATNALAKMQQSAIRPSIPAAADEEATSPDNVEDAPVADKRKENALYKTPKGIFRWTANGWKPL